MSKLFLAALFAAAAFGQEVDRSFRLTHATATSSQQEILTTLRTLTRIQSPSVGAGAMLTVAGTAEQIRMAEWLARLDVAAGAHAGAEQYAVGGNSDDLMLVYGLAHAETPMGIQEIITTLRTVADIQKIYQVSAPRVVTVRGSASQVALAKFLLAELDAEAWQPGRSATAHEYQIGGNGADTVVVYGLAHTATSLNLQVTITNLRTVLDVQKIYAETGPKLLAVRGSAALLQVAGWLIHELDRETPNASGNQMRMPGGNDDVVQVFYLTHLTSRPGIDGLLTAIRTTARIARAYDSVTPPALVLRGTADRIAMAGRMVEAGDRLPQ